MTIGDEYLQDHADHWRKLEEHDEALERRRHAPAPRPPIAYVECAFPKFARWVIVGESPAEAGRVFAREQTTGKVFSFPREALRPLEREEA